VISSDPSSNLVNTNQNENNHDCSSELASPVQVSNKTSPAPNSQNRAANLTPTIMITAPVDTTVPTNTSITDQLPPQPASTAKPGTNKKSLRKSSFAAGRNFLIQRRKTIHDIINLDIFNSLIGESKTKTSGGSHGGSSYFLNKSNTPNDSNSSSKSSSKKYHASTNNLNEKSSNETIAALCKQTLATAVSVATRDIAESLAPLSPPESHTSTTSLSAPYSQHPKQTTSSPPLLGLPPQPHMHLSQQQQQNLSMNPAVSSSHSIGSGMHKSSTISNIVNTLQIKTSDSMYSINSDMINTTAMAEPSNNNSNNRIDFSISRELVKQGSVQLVNVRKYIFSSQFLIYLNIIIIYKSNYFSKLVTDISL
jgi:hypothetical protein